MSSGNGNSPSDKEYPGDCDFTAFLLKKAATRQQCDAVGNLSREACLAKAKELKLLLLDVDGVLTDGSITYNHEGEEIKSFNSKDGFGLNMLRKIGVEVGIITARGSKALERRCRDLSLVHIHQGVRNKVDAWRTIISDLGLNPKETGFIGDDWLDLPLLTKVGFAATVADGAPELKNIVHFVADHKGGMGGVRDICDLIIEAKGKREELLQEYLTRQ